MRFIYFIFIIFISVPLFAFEIPQDELTPDYRLGVYTAKTGVGLSFDNSSQKLEGLHLGRLGFSFAYKGIGFGYAPIALDDDNALHSPSKGGYDYYFNWFLNRVGVEAGIDKTISFLDKQTDQRYEDFTVRSMYATGYFSFYSDYSMKDPLDYPKNKVSYGPMLSATYLRKKINNSLGILTPQVQSDLNVAYNMSQVATDVTSLSLGYGITGKTIYDLFFSARFFVGPSLQRSHTDFIGFGQARYSTFGAQTRAHLIFGQEIDSWSWSFNVFHNMFEIPITDVVKAKSEYTNIMFRITKDF